MFEKYLITPMTKYIHKMFGISFNKEWFETYWVIDLHSTVIKPSYKPTDDKFIFYPYAKETLQILSDRKDIKLIMWTSSFPSEIEFYISEFKKSNILFDCVNENPNISSNNGNFGFYEKKFYFNILFDDKSAFDPETDWYPIYNLLKKYEESGYLPNPKWTTKY